MSVDWVLYKPPESGAGGGTVSKKGKSMPRISTYPHEDEPVSGLFRLVSLSNSALSRTPSRAALWLTVRSSSS